MAKSQALELSELGDSIDALTAKLPTLVSGRTPVSVVQYGTVTTPGDTVLYMPTVYTPLNAVDIASEATLHTPASGKTFYLMGMYLALDVDGDVVFKKAASGATLLVLTFKAGVPTPLLTFGNGIAMAAADALLRADGPASSHISGYVFGREV